MLGAGPIKGQRMLPLFFFTKVDYLVIAVVIARVVVVSNLSSRSRDSIQILLEYFRRGLFAAFQFGQSGHKRDVVRTN